MADAGELDVPPAPEAAPAPRRNTLELLRHAFAGAGALAFGHVVASAITQHLGETAAVHATLIVSLAVGFAVGLRPVIGRLVWLRSSLVGVLAIVCSGALPGFTQLATRGALPTSTVGAISLAAVMAFVAAAVMGFTFGATGEDESSAFVPRGRAAWLVGGALGVVLIELVVARHVGMQGALFVVAFFAFLPCVRGRPTEPLSAPHAVAHPHAFARGRLRFEVGVGATLGLFLETTRPIARHVIGPAHENWAALAGGVALSLAIATLVGAKLPTSRARLLFIAALIAATSLLTATDLFAGAVVWWQDADDPSSRALAKLGFLSVLVGPSVLALSTAASGHGRSPRVIGHLAVGLAIGLLVARFALQPRVPLAVLVCTVPVLAALIALMSTPRLARVDGAALLGLSALLVLCAVRFPERLLSGGMLDPGSLDDDDGTVIRMETFRARGEELAILRDSHGTERVRGNGHDDAVAHDGVPSALELLAGVVPALYAKDHDRAFVYGGPGGVAAGTTARLFRQVTFVESNPAAAGVLTRLGRYNFDVARRDNVRLEVGADPFIALLASNQTFDAIVSATPAMRDLGASKTTTVEFLRVARDHLAPGGVVVVSVDHRLPVSGLAVLLRTLSDTFPECHFAYLQPERYAVVCGKTLTPRPLTPTFPQDVLTALIPVTAELGANRFFEALLLVPNRFHGDWFPVVSSFDMPVIDHVMAREDNRITRWDLDLAVHFDMDRAVLGGASFAGAKLFERCFALGLVGQGRTLPRCGRMMRAATGRDPGAIAMPLPKHFLELSAAASRRDARSLLFGSALLKELLYAGQQDEARALVATRTEKGVLTGAEQNFAKREGLLD